MAAYVQFNTIATGEMREAWCDRCHSSSANQVDLVGLSDDGPIMLGMFTTCPRCNEAGTPVTVWRCALCSDVLRTGQDGDGTAIAEHLHTVHGTGGH